MSIDVSLVLCTISSNLLNTMYCFQCTHIVSQHHSPIYPSFHICHNAIAQQLAQFSIPGSKPLTFYHGNNEPLLHQIPWSIELVHCITMVQATTIMNTASNFSFFHDAIVVQDLITTLKTTTLEHGTHSKLFQSIWNSALTFPDTILKHSITFSGI